MMRTLLALLGCAVGTGVLPTVHAADRKPNIIVFFCDDLGYADVGAQGRAKDVRTPNLDRMAAEGVRCTAGYITAPQCSPSRVGLITGRYQQRFGIDTIPDLPMPLEAVTIPERLKPAGYVSGMVGKWHLDPTAPGVTPKEKLRFFPQAQGFDDYFCGEMNQYFANYNLKGEDVEPQWIADKRFRVDVQTEAALAFVERNKARPIFLYVAYFAPHTPLEIPPAYSGPFTNDMALRRRAALSMLAGVDAGVGKITAALKRHGIDANTLVFFTSDNGAPVHKRRDSPLAEDMGGWDGSLNTPWVGEKGMLSEGGIRVPFLVRWPGTLPAGKIYPHAVSSLDIAATANAVAGLPAAEELDGVNLIPHLSGKKRDVPHGQLYWRFWSQAAVREGNWKLLHRAGEPDHLFDVTADEHEKIDLAEQQPEKVKSLRARLEHWAGQIQPPGMPSDKRNKQEEGWYRVYFPSSPEEAARK